MQAQGSSKGRFFPIRLTSLRLNTIIGFDLYLQPEPGHPPVLYREKSLPFCEAESNRLRDNQVAQLFVRSDQESAYYPYIEANLRAILTDPGIDVEEKTQVLYSSAMHLAKDAMEEPLAATLLPRTKAMVENTVWCIFNQEQALLSLLKVTSYDYYTYTHSVNVLVFTIALAKRLGYPDQAVNAFGSGSLLHDIGKSMIDPSILNCPGQLTKEQWEVMKMHPVYGCNILQKQGVRDKLMLDVTRHHHENLAGKGYPDRLTAEQIPQFIRISTISDVFDALTTRRPYKDALSSFEALKLMKEEMEEDLDQELFQAFVEMMGAPGE